MAKFSIVEQKNKLLHFFGLNDDTKADDEDDYLDEQDYNRTPSDFDHGQMNRQDGYTPVENGSPAFNRTYGQNNAATQSQPVAQTNFHTAQEPQVNSQSNAVRKPEAYTAVDKKPRFGNKENVVPLKNPNKGAGNATMSAQITIVQPKVYSEALGIAKKIVANEAVIVNFTLIEEAQARRIVDFLTGTVYALGGDIQRIGSEIFLCTPINITIDGATAKSLLGADDLVDY